VGLVQLGRPAESGETYVVAASPLAIGEALDDVACDAIFNQPIESVSFSPTVDSIPTSVGITTAPRKHSPWKRHAGWW